MGDRSLSEAGSMTRKVELLSSFDEVWSRKWESLQNVLEGVSDEEAHYQSPIYADEKHWLGEEKSGTILWFLQHLSQCYVHYRQMIENRPSQTPDPEPPQANTLEIALKNLHLHRGELRESLVKIAEEGLKEKVYNGLTAGSVYRLSIRHDNWHSGQIAVARRLYRYRDRLKS
jgi:hypothetical protein